MIAGTSNHPASTSWRSRWQSQGWPCGRACQTCSIYNVSCHAASAAINKGSPGFANKWVLHVSWDLLPVSTAWRRERSEELLPTPARNCEPASPKSGPAIVKKIKPPLGWKLESQGLTRSECERRRLGQTSLGLPLDVDHDGHRTRRSAFLFGNDSRFLKVTIWSSHDKSCLWTCNGDSWCNRFLRTTHAKINSQNQCHAET